MRIAGSAGKGAPLTGRRFRANSTSPFGRGGTRGMAACCDPVYKRPSCRRTATHTRTAASGAPSSRRRSRSAGRSILTNLAQTGLTTADVILMGWLGPEALAAGALGTNLYFAFLIFGIGVVTATAPLHRPGARPQAPLGARRAPHGPPGLVGRGRDLAPGLGRAVERRSRSCFCSARSRRSPPRRRPTCARCNGRSCPSSASSCCAPSSPRCERPRWILVDRASWRCRSTRARLGAHVRQARLRRRSGSPAPGSRPRVASLFMFVGLALVIVARPPLPALPPLRPLLAAGLAALPQASGGSACRSAARSSSRSGCSTPPPS